VTPVPVTGTTALPATVYPRWLSVGIMLHQASK
jgi:hypothetical protein